jgi:hypothetical protein
MALTVNTDQLMNDARCIDKCIPDGEKMAVLISVLYQLLQNGTGGGGGGGSGVTSVTGDGVMITNNASTGAVTLTLEPLLTAFTAMKETEIVVSGTSIDWSLGGVFTVALAASTVFTFANVTAGRVIKVAITGDASHTVTWPAVKWPGGSPPVQTLSKVDTYTFIGMASGSILGSVVQNMS